MPLTKIAVFGAVLALVLGGCGSTVPPPVQISPADIARQAAAPIPVSPRVAKVYQQDYLGQVGKDSSGIFALSPNGNRFEYRTCHHPDCQLSDDELASRAIARCNIGVPHQDPALRCLVFDRSGRIGQPYRFWSDGDFDMPIPAPSPLPIADPEALAGRYAAMTPEGQLVISLRPDGRAYFWDTGDGFHQGTWSLKEGGVCVDSVDGRSAVTCGTLYGSDVQHVVGAGLDLYPGRYLPLTRLPATAE